MSVKVLISGCLLGQNVKYNGQNNLTRELLNLKCEFVSVCPEVLGGLTTPRDPSEIRGEKVFTCRGVDVTKEFESGAYATLQIALKNDIKIAILKSNSPSCGEFSYDGAFSKKLIAQHGLTYKLLSQNGIKIFDETQAGEIGEFLKSI